MSRPHTADRHDLIRVHGACENNLKDVSVELPKRRRTLPRTLSPRYPVGLQKIPAYAVANARIGLARDNAEIALFVTNLFDQRIITEIVRSPVRTSSM